MTSTKKIKTPQVAPLAGMSALGIKPKVKTSTKVKTTKSPELIVTDQEISHQEVWNFVQEHAGGNEATSKLYRCQMLISPVTSQCLLDTVVKKVVFVKPFRTGCCEVLMGICPLKLFSIKLLLLDIAVKSRHAYLL